MNAKPVKRLLLAAGVASAVLLLTAQQGLAGVKVTFGLGSTLGRGHDAHPRGTLVKTDRHRDRDCACNACRDGRHDRRGDKGRGVVRGRRDHGRRRPLGWLRPRRPGRHRVIILPQPVRPRIVVVRPPVLRPQRCGNVIQFSFSW